MIIFSIPFFSASDLRLLQAAAAAAASGFGGSASADADGEIFDDLFPDDYNLDAAGLTGGAASAAANNLGGGGGAAAASSSMTGVHSALSRWGEEARVLDGDSVHDCLTGEREWETASCEQCTMFPSQCPN